MGYFWRWRRNSQRQRKTSGFCAALANEKGSRTLSTQHFQWNFSWNSCLKPGSTFQFVLFNQTKSFNAPLHRIDYFRTGIRCEKEIIWVTNGIVATEMLTNRYSFHAENVFSIRIRTNPCSCLYPKSMLTTGDTNHRIYWISFYQDHRCLRWHIHQILCATNQT